MLKPEENESWLFTTPVCAERAFAKSQNKRTVGYGATRQTSFVQDASGLTFLLIRCKRIDYRIGWFCRLRTDNTNLLFHEFRYFPAYSILKTRRRVSKIPVRIFKRKDFVLCHPSDLFNRNRKLTSKKYIQKISAS